MTLAAIIVAHNRPKQAALLASTLRHPDVRVYLHVDRRTPIEMFTRALEDAGVRDVTLLPRHPAVYCGPGVVDAEIAGLDAATADGCGYFMLLSGQDLPLKPIEEIVEFSQAAATRSFIEHWPLHASRHRFEGRDRTDFYTYTVRGQRRLCIPRGEDASFLNLRGRLLNDALRLRGALKGPRRFPAYVSPYAGATWWNLSREAADEVLRFVVAHPDYRRYHEHTMTPEEIFVQSILAGTDFAARYEVVDDAQRFYRWEGTRARVLTCADLDEMTQSDKLFARKFDSHVDAVVMEQVTELVTR